MDQLGVSGDGQVHAVGQLSAGLVSENSFAVGAVPVLGAAVGMASLNGIHVDQLGVSGDGQVHAVGHNSASLVSIDNVAISAVPVLSNAVSMASFHSFHVDQSMTGNRLDAVGSIRRNDHQAHDQAQGQDHEQRFLHSSHCYTPSLNFVGSLRLPKPQRDRYES